MNTIDPICKQDWLIFLSKIKLFIQDKYLDGFGERDFLFLTPFVSLYILPFEVLASIGELFTESIMENLPLYMSHNIEHNIPIVIYLKSLDISVLNGIVAYVKTHPTNSKAKLDRFVANMVKVIFADLEMMDNPISQMYILYWNNATKIQRQWRNCIANPKFFVCKRRLMREINELHDLT
jgi:hypothetical protein